MKDKTMKTITDVLSSACHVPIREVCVLEHNEKYFKAYVHGTRWYDRSVYEKIMNAWNLEESQIDMTLSPELWKKFGSTGYIINVKY